MREFVHLHNHTHYSILDSINSTDDLIKGAVEDGQKAVALTDHGVMYGAFEFYQKARNAGIKPIIGFEAYVADGSRFDRDAGKNKSDKRKYFHLILLAKNEKGYKNLMKLCSLGFTEGFYYKPRIDKELLEKYNSGIVCCSGCISGVVNAHLVGKNPDEERAYQEAKYYKDLFGDDFYIELQNHHLNDDEIVLAKAPKIAEKLDIKIVATNDIHYLKREHSLPHNIFLHIRDASTAANSSSSDEIYKLRYKTDELYFRSQKEMNELFSDMPEAISNTIEIADKCNLEIDTTRHTPECEIPESSEANNLDEYLREKVYEGLEKRYSEITEEVRERAESELKIICDMGFPGYFLIVQDFINAAKERGVMVGPGRGSAAGSLAAYALGITNIDPLPYGLLFERFLNPERVSMPDIDIDFSDDKRDRVFQYVIDKYGEKSVAQIITFGKLHSRAVLKDVGRVLGIHHSDINQITKKIPVIQGKVMKLEEALKLPELREWKESEEGRIEELISYSLVLEGKIRTTSTHAAGVVIAPGDIDSYVPISLQRKDKSGNKEQVIDYVAQYSMNELEAAGLLKMDFLGLKTLTIIENAVNMIEENHGDKIDIDEIDFEDEKTFDLIGQGKTLAVFQFESEGMREYLKQLKPKDLEELTAMNALYRPGPMDNIPEFIDRKFGKKEIKYLHPIMENSLKKTYGIIVYQEQVMQLARDIAGFTLGEADVLRKAMGKKKVKIMAKQKPKFIEGAKEKGFDKKTAEEIFDLIGKFASYGFNKSHSLAYSYLAYQTAWLKANYPAEFFAANMTSEIDSQDSQEKIANLIDDAKTFGVELAPPDINLSQAKFIAKKDKIFFGLAAIKNVGKNAVEKIVARRQEKKFESFYDFVRSVGVGSISRRTIEALIYAGAFDSLMEATRSTFFASIDVALDYAKSCERAASESTESMFGDGGNSMPDEPRLVEAQRWSDAETLEKEKEFLNFYISGHPLDRYRLFVDSLSTVRLSEAKKNANGGKVRVCGLISGVKTKYDKKERLMAVFNLEDFSGKAACLIWSDSFAKCSQNIRNDTPAVVIGKIDSSSDDLKILVEDVQTIESAAKSLADGYYIWLDSDDNDKSQIEQLHKLCSAPGEANVLNFQYLDRKNSLKKAYYADNINISFDFNTVESLINIFGENSVRLIVK